MILPKICIGDEKKRKHVFTSTCHLHTALVIYTYKLDKGKNLNLNSNLVCLNGLLRRTQTERPFWWQPRLTASPNVFFILFQHISIIKPRTWDPVFHYHVKPGPFSPPYHSQLTSHGLTHCWPNCPSTMMVISYISSYLIMLDPSSLCQPPSILPVFTGANQSKSTLNPLSPDTICSSLYLSITSIRRRANQSAG